MEDMDTQGVLRDETVRCLLVLGDQAELVLEGAEIDDAVRWPAALIEAEAGMLRTELPGSLFRVVVSERGGRVEFSGFRLLAGGLPETSR